MYNLSILCASCADFGEIAVAKQPRENRVPIMMSESELGAIDDWRFMSRVATRSDAIRRLCQLGLRYESDMTSAGKVIARALDAIDQAGRKVGAAFDVKSDDKARATAAIEFIAAINAVANRLELDAGEHGLKWTAVAALKSANSDTAEAIKASQSHDDFSALQVDLLRVRQGETKVDLSEAKALGAKCAAVSVGAWVRLGNPFDPGSPNWSAFEDGWREGA